MKSLKVVEFYSGIGGLHLGLRDITGFKFEIAAAFDINTSANSVYRHNFPGVSLQQRNIQSISIEELTKFDADMFLMSPPCQPFTRQGKRMDTADNRTNSFMHLLDAFSELPKPPTYILLENVKGFEESEARNAMIAFLRKAGYFYREFLLSPVQFGVPNSRLRYYLLARLSSKCDDFSSGNSQEILKSWHCSPGIDRPKQLSEYLDDSITDHSKFLLDDRTLAKYGEIVDIVTPNDRRSCCFTKGYGHYVEGTGSVLTTASKELINESYKLYRSATNDDEKSSSLHPLKLRYFTPREIANLMCFPKEYEFPTDSTTRQQYRLLGNSVNVRVVHELIKSLVEHNEMRLV